MFSSCVGNVHANLFPLVNVKPGLEGPFWHGVEVAGDHYDIIGGSICGCFLVFGCLSVLLYKPWRRRIDRERTLDTPETVVDDDREKGLL